MCYEKRDTEQARACFERDQRRAVYHYCLICRKPIMVGEPAFEIGYRYMDKELICTQCKDSIVPYDTEKEVAGDG